MIIIKFIFLQETKKMGEDDKSLAVSRSLYYSGETRKYLSKWMPWCRPRIL